MFVARLAQPGLGCREVALRQGFPDAGQELGFGSLFQRLAADIDRGLQSFPEIVARVAGTRCSRDSRVRAELIQIGTAPHGLRDLTLQLGLAGVDFSLQCIPNAFARILRASLIQSGSGFSQHFQKLDSCQTPYCFRPRNAVIHRRAHAHGYVCDLGLPLERRLPGVDLRLQDHPDGFVRIPCPRGVKVRDHPCEVVSFQAVPNASGNPGNLRPRFQQFLVPLDLGQEDAPEIVVGILCPRRSQPGLGLREFAAFETLAHTLGKGAFRIQKRAALIDFGLQRIPQVFARILGASRNHLGNCGRQVFAPPRQQRLANVSDGSGVQAGPGMIAVQPPAHAFGHSNDLGLPLQNRLTRVDFGFKSCPDGFSGKLGASGNQHRNSLPDVVAAER